MNGTEMTTVEFVKKYGMPFYSVKGAYNDDHYMVYEVKGQYFAAMWYAESNTCEIFLENPTSPEDLGSLIGTCNESANMNPADY